MKEYRHAVIKDLQSRAGIINAQEFFGSRDQKPLDTCLEELEKSQVFIMFLGPRYGSIDEASGMSFVECEYERACELGLPIFAYIIDENQSFTLKYVSKGSDAEKLLQFKKKVKSELTISTFTTPTDLAFKVFSDLFRELPKRDFVLGQESPEEEHAGTLRVLQEFQLLPKLFHGHTVSFKARLGECERASEDECDAFGYDYGTTLKRKVKPVDSVLRRTLRNANWLFAHGESAITLLKAPDNKETYLTAKTLQGEYTEIESIYGHERENGIFENLAFHYAGRKKVVVDTIETNKLLCGLEFLEVLPG